MFAAATMLDPNQLHGETVSGSRRLFVSAGGQVHVYCTPDPSHYARFNTVYDRYFAAQSPARIFLHVPSHSGPFDIEVDCVATV
jgi:hypothetical protein